VCSSQVTDVVFASIFTFELVLKVVSFGLYKYVYWLVDGVPCLLGLLFC